MMKLIPLISPFFKQIDGEVHHHARYKRYPARPAPANAIGLFARPFIPTRAYMLMGDAGWLRQARRNRVVTHLRARPFRQA